MIEGIEGHRNLTNSSIGESNHASLVALAPDDPSRTLEQNIIDVMERTKLLFEQRVLSKAQYASATAEINAMSGKQASHLSEPRQKLDQLPYQEFKKQYECYMQYNCRDVVQDNVSGCIVSHTSSPGDGYFIPDGQPCHCKYERRLWKVGGCRHGIAKRIHRKESPFSLETVHPSNLFREELPVSFSLATRVSLAATGVHTNVNAVAGGGMDNEMDMFGEDDLPFDMSGGTDVDIVGAGGVVGKAEQVDTSLAVAAASPEHMPTC